MNAIVYGLVKASAVDKNTDGGGEDKDKEIRDARRSLALTGALTGIIPGTLLGMAGGDASFGLLGAPLGALVGGGLGYLQGRSIDNTSERFLREHKKSTAILADVLSKKNKEKEKE